MKKLIFMLLLSVSSSFADADVIAELRAGYQPSVYSEKVCNQMSDLAASNKSTNAVAQAYYAALQGLKAKHAWNPYQKLSYVKEFEKEINQAVVRSPKNLEIRYLRYGIEINIPAMVGLKKHVEEDLKVMYDLFISATISTSEKSFYQGVFDFLKSQKSYSDAQFKALQVKLNQVK